MHKRTLAAALAALLSAVALPALAVDACANLVTVQMSAIPEMNAEAGGHLAAHIPGVQPPAGFSQFGRTLFWDQQAWREAFDQLARQQNPLYCPEPASEGAEAARTLQLQAFARQCTATDGNGLCTAATSIQANAVQIVMRRINRRWVVYTAYPTPN
ncbi:MAG: hypothetical protein HOQ32_03795 [Lysobacter sp.]|nr:hypothetical protein [Lysobacter sp.]